MEEHTQGGCPFPFFTSERHFYEVWEGSSNQIDWLRRESTVATVEWSGRTCLFSRYPSTTASASVPWGLSYLPCNNNFTNIYYHWLHYRIVYLTLLSNPCDRQKPNWSLEHEAPRYHNIFHLNAYDSLLAHIVVLQLWLIPSPTTLSLASWMRVRTWVKVTRTTLLNDATPLAFSLGV